MSEALPPPVLFALTWAVAWSLLLPVHALLRVFRSRIPWVLAPGRGCALDDPHSRRRIDDIIPGYSHYNFITSIELASHPR